MSVEIDLVRALDESLRLLFTDPGHRGICVGFSGGPDSLALVHALVKVRTRRTSFSLRAAHVNHGLSPNADEWENQCATVCRQLDLSLEVRAVDVTSRGGASPEEAAREARYGALSSMLGEGEVLCTAHHRDDQCETLLLQLLRGSGPRGLAAMPGVAATRRRVALASSIGHAPIGLGRVSDRESAFAGFRRDECVARRRSNLPSSRHLATASASLAGSGPGAGPGRGSPGAGKPATRRPRRRRDGQGPCRRHRAARLRRPACPWAGSREPRPTMLAAREESADAHSAPASACHR